MRIGFVVLSLLAGAGVLLYAWLWIFLPSGEEASQGAERSRGTRTRTLSEELDRMQQAVTTQRMSIPSLDSLREILIGAALLGLAGLGLSQWMGWDVRWDLIWPALITVGGLVFSWMQIDRGVEKTGRAGRWISVLRLSGALVLVLIGLFALLSGLVSTDDLLAGFWTALAMIAGVVLVLLPWATRFWRDFLSERSNRQAAAQRAEIAAHLHDSVLQTLAIIQKRSEEPAAVRVLARSQERELRQWLYGSDQVEDTDLVKAIETEATEIEQLLLADIDVVWVGRAQMFNGAQALVQASREAIMNAAKHAGGKITVYIECAAEQIEVFVRDRGTGFDPELIAEDRHGVRESMIARMQRAGGQSTINSSASGTEVHLVLPRSIGKDEHS